MTSQIPPILSPFIERLQQLFPTDWERVVQNLHHHPPTAIRINTLRMPAEKLLPQLESYGFEWTPVSGLADAYVQSNEVATKLSSLPEWKEGFFAIQSLSSQLVSVIVAPQKDQLILDACASPGSKTSHLAMLMKNLGTIVANDASWARVGKLKDVISMLGVTNVVPVNLPAEVLWRDYENTFDHALVDVPCTMEGRIKLDEPKTYEDWSIKKIKRLSTEQKGILRSVVRCVKPGGTITYSTCTLAPEENEEVIDWLLRKEEGIEILPIDTTDLPTTPPILHWQQDHFDPRLKNCVRILPSGAWEGFFVAKMRRKVNS